MLHPATLKFNVLSLLAACSLAISSLSYSQQALSLEAQTQDSSFQWVTSLGFSFGGAEATKVQYDGNHNEIEAGGPVYMGIGGDYSIGDSAFSVQGMLASQFDSADADNGDASLVDRTEFDLIGFYGAGIHRFGMGLTHHISPKFQTEQASNNESTRFNDSTGLILEYNYRYSPATAVGVRLTDINYSSSELSDKSTIDGDNIGFFIKSFF